MTTMHPAHRADPRTEALLSRLSLPAIGAPMFIVSYPTLVIAQCLAGIVGAFPALNARPKELLDEWLTELDHRLDAARAGNPGARIAPYAVNQIVHPTNDRLDHDFAVCVRHRVQIVITSGQPRRELVQEVHGYGGMVLHVVASLRHAESALRHGADGLVLVAAGAGGHAGTLSPFALVAEARRLCDGPLALGGAIGSGSGILAAQTLGADFAYIGTRFIASAEANANGEYKQMIRASVAEQIVYTPFFTGLPGNYLQRRIDQLGLDLATLAPADRSKLNVKSWRDVWTAGQGVGAVDDEPAVAELVLRMRREYREAVLRQSAQSANFLQAGTGDPLHAGGAVQPSLA